MIIYIETQVEAGALEGNDGVVQKDEIRFISFGEYVVRCIYNG